MTVRLVAGDDDEELRAWLWGIRQSFLSGKDITDEWLTFAREKWDLDRCWTAVDGGKVCGSTRTFASDLCLPGLGQVPVSCLSAVTVLPTHTRRGHVTELMRAQLRAALEAGEVASLLIAAEWPIYGRFGYGPATQWVDIEVDTDRASLRPDLPAPVGHCELLSPADFLAPLREVHRAQQAMTPGSILRRDAMLPIDAGSEERPGHERKESRVRVVHYDEGGRPDGFVVYDPEEKWDGMRPCSVATVEDVAWTSPTAERELWRYLLAIDLVSTVKYQAPPRTAVQSFLADGRAAQVRGVWDDLWAVVLDVPAAFSARRYTGPGSVRFEVLDPFLGRGGRYALSVDDAGVGVCEPAGGGTVDLTLSLADLSASWLGGTDLSHADVAGRIDEHRSGAAAELAALLRWWYPPESFTHF